jgi:hypothetical protein
MGATLPISRLRRAVAIAAVLATSSLPTQAGSRIAAQLHNDQWTGQRFETVLVIGATQNTAIRGDFERKLAQRLRGRGVTGVASDAVIPVGLIGRRETLEGTITDLEIDGVIFVRFLSVERATSASGGIEALSPTVYQGALYDYHAAAFERPATPGFIGKRDMLRLETSLFSAATGNLVWSMVSETYPATAPDKVVGSLSKLIVKALGRDGLI